LGQIPTLEVDGKLMVQAQAISRYLATKFNLYGTDAEERASIDEVTETLCDIAADLTNVVFGGLDEETLVSSLLCTIYAMTSLDVEKSKKSTFM